MKSLIITKYLPLSKKDNQQNISRFNTFRVKDWLIFTSFKKPELHEYLYPISKLPISFRDIDTVNSSEMISERF